MIILNISLISADLPIKKDHIFHSHVRVPEGRGDLVYDLIGLCTSNYATDDDLRCGH